jgi:hypothetical protein
MVPKCESIEALLHASLSGKTNGDSLSNSSTDKLFKESAGQLQQGQPPRKTQRGCSVFL